MNRHHRNLAITKSVCEQGEPVAKVAKRFGLSRQQVYNIKRAYETGGADAIAPKSKAPKTHPTAVPDKVRTRIIELRTYLTKEGFDTGPETIRTHLRNEGVHTPAESTIRRILHTEDLVTPQPHKRPKSSLIRFEANLPNECWQADITYTFLIDGTRVEVLDFLDDHSRYLLHLHVKAAFSGLDVVDALEQTIDTYGAPASTLTDNGLVFTSRFTSQPGARNAFEKALNKHRIQQKNGRPGHPQTQGKIERFHQTLKKWLAARKPAATIKELQHQLDTFRNYYNCHRPHRALGGDTPLRAYQAKPKAHPDNNPTREARVRHDTVDKAGQVTLRYAGRLHHLGIGRAWAGEKVTMTINDRHIMTSVDETKKVITEHYLDPTHDYQKPFWKKGTPPPT